MWQVVQAVQYWLSFWCFGKIAEMGQEGFCHWRSIFCLAVFFGCLVGTSSFDSMFGGVCDGAAIVLENFDLGEAA